MASYGFDLLSGMFGSVSRLIWGSYPAERSQQTTQSNNSSGSDRTVRREVEEKQATQEYTFDDDRVEELYIALCQEISCKETYLIAVTTIHDMVRQVMDACVEGNDPDVFPMNDHSLCHNLLRHNSSMPLLEALGFIRKRRSEGDVLVHPRSRAVKNPLALYNILSHKLIEAVLYDLYEEFYNDIEPLLLEIRAILHITLTKRKAETKTHINVSSLPKLATESRSFAKFLDLMGLTLTKSNSSDEPASCSIADKEELTFVHHLIFSYCCSALKELKDFTHLFKLIHGKRRHEKQRMKKLLLQHGYQFEKALVAFEDGQRATMLGLTRVQFREVRDSIGNPTVGDFMLKRGFIDDIQQFVEIPILSLNPNTKSQERDKLTFFTVKAWFDVKFGLKDEWTRCWVELLRDKLDIYADDSKRKLLKSYSLGKCRSADNDVTALRDFQSDDIVYRVILQTKLFYLEFQSSDYDNTIQRLYDYLAFAFCEIVIHVKGGLGFIGYIPLKRTSTFEDFRVKLLISHHAIVYYWFGRTLYCITHVLSGFPMNGWKPISVDTCKDLKVSEAYGIRCTDAELPVCITVPTAVSAISGTVCYRSIVPTHHICDETKESDWNTNVRQCQYLRELFHGNYSTNDVIAREKECLEHVKTLRHGDKPPCPISTHCRSRTARHCALYAHPERWSPRLPEGMHPFLYRSSKKDIDESIDFALDASDMVPVKFSRIVPEWNASKELIHEIICNGFLKNLCTGDQLSESELKRRINFDPQVHQCLKLDPTVLTVLSKVDALFIDPIHRQMGYPCSKTELLCLYLYTSCYAGKCAGDMCKSQIKGDYEKWNCFDFYLNRAITVLGQCEQYPHDMKLYSGVLNVRVVESRIAHGRFASFVSSTPDQRVAHMFLGNNGMIIEFQPRIVSRKLTAPHCDVSWLSDIPAEQEILFARAAVNIMVSSHEDVCRFDKAWKAKVVDATDAVQIVSINLP